MPPFWTTLHVTAGRVATTSMVQRKSIRRSGGRELVVRMFQDTEACASTPAAPVRGLFHAACGCGLLGHAAKHVPDVGGLWRCRWKCGFGWPNCLNQCCRLVVIHAPTTALCIMQGLPPVRLLQKFTFGILSGSPAKVAGGRASCQSQLPTVRGVIGNPGAVFTSAALPMVRLCPNRSASSLGLAFGSRSGTGSVVSAEPVFSLPSNASPLWTAERLAPSGPGAVQARPLLPPCYDTIPAGGTCCMAEKWSCLWLWRRQGPHAAVFLWSPF